MRHKGSFGRVIVLLLLIIILAVGGLFWFSYLGLVYARSVFAPVYSLFGLKTPEGVASPADSAMADLDADRYAKRLVALDIRSQELDKKEAEVTAREKEAAQVSQELDDRLSIIEEKEKSFKQMMAETEIGKRMSIKLQNTLTVCRPIKRLPISYRWTIKILSMCCGR